MSITNINEKVYRYGLFRIFEFTVEKKLKKKCFLVNFAKILKLTLMKKTLVIHSLIYKTITNAKKVSKEYKLKTVFHKPVRRLRTIVYKILISKQASINKRSQKLRRLSRIISTKILQKILKFERGKSRKIIFKLFLVLTSMIYKSQFSAQNFAFTSIKFSSFEDYSKLNSEISEANHFGSKDPGQDLPYLLQINSMEILKYENSSDSLKLLKKNSEKTFELSSPELKLLSPIPMSVKSKGILNFSKYLINRKKLEMIKEDFSSVEQPKQLVKLKKKKNSEKKSLPP